MRQWWTFTFGIGSPYKDYVVRILGEPEQAREAMVAMHGTKWCGQYPEAEGDRDIEKYHYKTLFVLALEEDGSW